MSLRTFLIFCTVISAIAANQAVPENSAVHFACIISTLTLNCEPGGTIIPKFTGKNIEFGEPKPKSA